MDDSSRLAFSPKRETRLPDPAKPVPLRVASASMLTPRDFPETRASLLATMQGEQKSADWHEFFNRYAPAVYRVALHRGVERHEAEDIVQQVMIDLAKHMGEFRYDRTRGMFRNWMRTIAEHKIANFHRRPKMQTTDAFPELATDTISRDSAWEEEWRIQDILECLDHVAADFAPRRVEAFRLYVLEHVPAAEVARRLDMTVGHVYVTRTQILKRIREWLLRMSPDSDA